MAILETNLSGKMCSIQGTARGNSITEVRFDAPKDKYVRIIEKVEINFDIIGPTDTEIKYTSDQTKKKLCGLAKEPEKQKDKSNMISTCH